MAEVRADLRYTPTHEWVRVEGDTATIGITDHAQAELGDIVYLDLPEPGRLLESRAQFGEVESVKAVSELYAPISGEVLESNIAITERTEVVNQDPFGEGWLIKMSIGNREELSSLLGAEDYRKLADEGDH